MWNRLSSYARQFLGQMEKPDVDYIEGLSPAISIDQKTTSKNPAFHGWDGDGNLRLSAPCFTRGSASRIARSAAGRSSSRRLTRLWTRFCRMEEGTKIQVLAPVVRGRKGEHVEGI